MIGKLYLAVTADRYELPIAVADSAIDLARMIRKPVDCVYQGCSRSLHRTDPEKTAPVPAGSMRFYRIEYAPDELMEVMDL